MKIGLFSGKLSGSKESQNTNNKQSNKDIKLLDDKNSINYGKKKK